MFLPIAHSALNWKLFQLVRFLCHLQNKPKGFAFILQLSFCSYKFHQYVISSPEEFLRRVNLDSFSTELDLVSLCHFLTLLLFVTQSVTLCFCLKYVSKGQKESTKIILFQDRQKDLRWLSFTGEYLNKIQLLHCLGREANFRGFWLVWLRSIKLWYNKIPQICSMLPQF